MDALQLPIDRLDQEVRQRAKADPRVKVLTQLPGVGPFTALVLLAEIGDISPVRVGAQAGVLGGAYPDGPRQRPDRPSRAHLQAGPDLGAVGAVRGRADRQAAPGLRSRLRGPRPPPRQEDRHHGGRPQAHHPRLSPAHRRQRRR